MHAYATTHLTDADLVRHLDAEGEAAERSRRAAHLEACEDCEGRVKLLRRQSDAVHAWLLRADATRPAAGSVPRGSASPAAPHRSHGANAWLRAAAIVLLLAAPLAAFPPVRDWVATRVGLRGGPVTAAAPAAQAAPVIRFIPAPGTFTVRIDGAPSSGALEIGRADGPEAELRGAGGAGAGAPIVSEDALRIPATGTASRYQLRVPTATTDIVVMMDGGTLRVPGAAIDRGRLVEFRGG